MNPDFGDMLSAFSGEGVEFLLVGAYAMAVHQVPRATGDIDLWIRRSESNDLKVQKALERFGAPLEPSLDEPQEADLVFQIGVAPRRIDILTSIDGVTIDEAWTDRSIVEIDGIRVPVIGRSHPLQNKKAVGRPKDLADIAWLEDSEEPS